MQNYSLFAEAIKERVSMPDAIALYAPTQPPKHNRVPCPIHGGTNLNMSFTDKVYHCFVCNSGGDVISFVQHVFGLSFPDALDKLNRDFNLDLPLHRRATLREQRDAQMRHRAITAEREKQEAARKEHEALYASLWDEYARLDSNARNYAPKSIDDEFHPLYVEALRKIDYQNYLIDTML